MQKKVKLFFSEEITKIPKAKSYAFVKLDCEKVNSLKMT